VDGLYALAVLTHSISPNQLGSAIDRLVLEQDCEDLTMRAVVRLMFAISAFGCWTIQRFGLLCMALRQQQTGKLGPGQLLVLKQAQMLLGEEGLEMAEEVLPAEVLRRAADAFAGSCCRRDPREQQRLAEVVAAVSELLPGWEVSDAVVGDVAESWTLDSVLRVTPGAGSGNGSVLLHLCKRSDFCSNADDRLLGPSVVLQRLMQGSSPGAWCVAVCLDGPAWKEQLRSALQTAGLAGQGVAAADLGASASAGAEDGVAAAESVVVH
jgi:hypothetical protein